MIRLADIVFSIVILILAIPLLIVVGLAIRLASPGPVLYLAERAGRGNEPFRMFKFRSMHVDSGGSEITATNDQRVFAVGRIVRALKLDELPQFFNVIRGDMAIVGPRPEAPAIVAKHYNPWMMETLDIRPGITSPGAIFYYAYGDDLLSSDDPETAYADKLLAPKLALDLAYAQRATLWSNIVVVMHTALSIVAKALGKSIGPQKRDINASTQWVSNTALMRGETTS